MGSDGGTQHAVVKMGMVVLIEFSFSKSLKQCVPRMKIIGTQLFLSGIPEVITRLWPLLPQHCLNMHHLMLQLLLGQGF